jgi:transcriptional regulator with XRE-family HTH domain
MTVAAIVTDETEPPTLREARLARGWAQSRLAEISGVPQSLISGLESGKRSRVGMRTWRRLSAALGIELYPKCGVPPSWWEFYASPFAEDLDDEVLGALIEIACSHRGWRRAPMRTWIALVDIIRAAMQL